MELTTLHPWRYRVAIWLFLAGAVTFSLFRLEPPSRDSQGFLTPNAMNDLPVIAKETHPVGSPHHQVVQDLIAARFEQLGFEVQLQKGHSSIPLTNILARKPGSAPQHKAIALAAHYDSARLAPGAGDDGAAVAALLETARIFSQTSHQNDLIYLITDGEELGLWGARIFVEQQHPWLNDISVILNFDARGTSGPSIMFETSPGNSWLIDLFAATSPHPVCSSVTADVYKLMPNRTDFTIWNQAGLTGLNFAFIGGIENYHQPTDDVNHLDPRSLRHDGLQALALTKELLEMNLASIPKTGDAIYFDIASLFVIHYPTYLSLVIAIVAALLAIVAIVCILKQQLAKPWRVAIALGMLLINLLIVTGLVKIISIPLPTNLAILSMVLIALICSLCFIAACYRCSIFDCACAALVFWLLAVVLPGPMPAGNYLFAWPLIGASIGAISLAFPISDNRYWLRVIVLALCSLPALLLWTPLIYLAFLGLTLKFAWALCLPVVLIVWLLALQLGFPRMRKIDVPA